VDERVIQGTAEAMEVLAALEPTRSARERKKQIVVAICTAAGRLENTPAICRKSYMHPTVITAFETGSLREIAAQLKRARSDAPAQAAVGALLEAAAA
jgi:DNA topoisomerase-1